MVFTRKSGIHALIAAVAAVALLSGVVADATADTTDLAPSAPTPAPVAVDSTVGTDQALSLDVDLSKPPVRLSTVTEAIGADELWRSGVTGERVGVAVIDTGMVPVLGLVEDGKVINGPDLSFDFAYEELRHLDAYGHGTHMAGIIAGNDGTSDGFRGVAPGAHLVNVKVGASDGSVDVSQAIAAIDWVVQHRNDPGLNIRVLNLSFGTDSVQSHLVDPLAYAVEVAWRHGIVVVVGAGNEGAEAASLINPATSPHVIAVGGADLHATAEPDDDTVAPFSSRGSVERHADLLAPGVSIASLLSPGSVAHEENPASVVDERFLRGSGTSQSAAVVSGAAALLLEARPSLTPDEIKALLTSTATPITGATPADQGAGMIDVARAAQAAVPADVAQPFAYGTGTGSLELARGSIHVFDGAVPLVGERDIFGRPWDGNSWAPAALAGTTWTDGTWNDSWTGSCACDDAWAGRSWAGRSWAGRSWAGRSWAGRSWAGRSWAGRSWAGRSWAGRSWAGRTWAGRSWAGRSWAGRSWAGRSWAGRTWAGRSWAGRSWAGRSWAGRSWAGRSWAGRSWAGRSWAGRSWAGRSWAGRTWAGRSWAGRTWAGRSWAGRSWAGRSWAGRSWAGRTWAGRSWADDTWTGRSWADDTWTGRSWADDTWTGRSWAGRSWAGRSWAGRSWA